MADSGLVFVLPDEAIDRLADAVADRLEARLVHRDVQQDRWLSTKEAAAYLGLSVSKLHGLTARREIPFSQDGGPGSRCWFRKSALDVWRAS